MLMENFKKQLGGEIVQLNDSIEKNKKILEQLKRLQQAHTIDGLIDILREINHPDHVRLVADSPACHALILENPEAFLSLFSREHIKTIIHQACKLGNLPLVRSLVEKIKLDVTLEKMANPHQDYSLLEDGTYVFLHSVPLCQVAAYSQSLELMLYVLSFYKLSQIKKTAIHGDLQIALTIAAEHCSYDIVRLLLSCGVNVNSVREARHSTTALYYAVLHGPLTLIDFLLESGAKISYLNQYHAVSRARLDVVQLFVSKGICFKNTQTTPFYLSAIESGSVAMAKYFIETLKVDIYESESPTETQKKRIDMEVVKKVALSGSTQMMQYIEDELHIPVTTFIQEELQRTDHFHRIFGDFILLNAVHSYNPKLLIFLFETKGLKPTILQLSQLLDYAYDNSRCLPQHKVFATHAYIYSLCHTNLSMQKLLSKAADSQNLTDLSSEELFLLFAVYTKNFKQTQVRIEHNILLRENSIHLSKEIAKRKIKKDDLLQLATSKDPTCVSDIMYYLIVSGQGYSQEEIIELLRDPVFDVNCRMDEGSHPLHLAIQYRKPFLIAALLAEGADPDLMNSALQTPITLIELIHKESFFGMLKQAKHLVNSFNYCISTDESERLILLLEHTGGEVPDVDLMDWLQRGRHCSRSIFYALCHLNEETFITAQKCILTLDDQWWLNVLSMAVEFRTSESKEINALPAAWVKLSLFSAEKIPIPTSTPDVSRIEEFQNTLG